MMAEDVPDTAAANPVPRESFAASLSTPWQHTHVLGSEAWSDLCPTYNALAEEDL